MIAAATTVTGLVAIGKVAVASPAATVTETGTVAARLLLASVTTAPPAGAAVPNVIVPVLEIPPVTTVGLTLTPSRREFTVSVAVLAAPPYLALTFTGVAALTVLVAIGKVAVIAPAFTITDGGTVTAVRLLLASVSSAPPAGAAVVSVTVPLLLLPPTSMEGFNVNEPSSGFTVSPTTLEMPS